MFKEATQHANRTARFLGPNKLGARDKRSDVAGGGHARNLRLRGFEQGVGDEFAQKKVRKR
jgi:hypothetical protein